jgi:uncharacterized protein (TIGR03000 family)
MPTMASLEPPLTPDVGEMAPAGIPPAALAPAAALPPFMPTMASLEPPLAPDVREVPPAPSVACVQPADVPVRASLGAPASSGPEDDAVPRQQPEREEPVTAVAYSPTVDLSSAPVLGGAPPRAVETQFAVATAACKPPEAKVVEPASNPPQAKAAPARAKLVVQLPPEAQLFIDGTQVPVGAGETTFTTPPLEDGGPCYYDLRAVVVRGGEVIAEEMRVVVRPGDVARVSFPRLPAAAPSGIKGH